MITLAQLITFEPLWEDHGIALAIMGMFVVFCALVLVSTFIMLLPRLMTGLERLHPEPKKQRGRSKPKTPPKPADDELPEEIQVVIAAAVAEVVGARHRIIRTRRLSADEQAWSLEGRMQHHTSHARVRREGS